LLIKFIDAKEDLSVQVHPNDELAKKRHNAYGKTEMWYVIDAEKGSRLVSGFNRKLDKASYLQYFKQGKIMEILSSEEVAAGDVFFTPAGRVHAIGKGILLSEIQQTSDVTYRIYDFNRKDKNGNERELHTDLALDAINFEYKESYKTNYKPALNQPVELAKCWYFTTNLLEFDQPLEKDIYEIDSFVIYICLGGNLNIDYDGNRETLRKGETLLVPASLNSFILTPVGSQTKVLEVFIQNS
jgi:mannose-6-phosphate isomerase